MKKKVFYSLIRICINTCVGNKVIQLEYTVNLPDCFQTPSMFLEATVPIL